MKRIEGRKGVIGTIIVNEDGIPIRTSMDNTTTVLYATSLRKICYLATSTIRDLNPRNDLSFVRVRTKKDEIIIAPDNGYLLIVIQSIVKNQ